MPISINRYVDITSGVAGAQSVPDRSLCGLRFTTDPRVPVDSVVTFTGDIAAEALTYFGSQSKDYDWSAQYAAYVSPAPASRAKILRFAAYVKQDRAARIFGKSLTQNLSDLKLITSGSLNLTLGETTKELTLLNFADATTLADVASTLQTAIRLEADTAAWATATVEFDAPSNAFNLVGGTLVKCPVGVLASTAPSDISAAIGWGFGAVMSPGSESLSGLDSLAAAESVTDSFGTFSFNPALPIVEAKQVATYNAGLNVKYQYYHTVSLLEASTHAGELRAMASCGVILNVRPGEYKESLPAAVSAAVDFDRTNAVVNYMYRQGPFPGDPITGENDVHDNTTASGLDTLRVNYYGTTAKAGQKISFFQRGYLMGGPTAPLDMSVHLNEQWFKSALQSDLLGAQLSLSQISADDQGRGAIIALLDPRIEQGKRNGTIRVGKTLTALQQIAITDITNDPDAWRDVQNSGVWRDAAIVSYVGESGVTEYKVVYTVVYSKNDVVRKIEGSHNLI